MQRISVDPTIGPEGAWGEGIQRANRMLEMIKGPLAQETTADWALVRDERQGPVLALTLSDDTGSVTEKFRPGEMQDGERLWERLNHLWGDLLQVRSHKLLERIRVGIENMED